MNILPNILSAATGNSWQPHYTENIISTVLISLLIFIAIKLCKHKFWGPKILQAFKPKAAKLGLSLVIFFFFIAFLDSLSWKDHYTEKDDVAVEAREARTVLDRTFSAFTGVPEYQFTERATSSPFSKTEFLDDSVELKYTHFMGTNAAGKDTLYMVLKGVKTAVLVGTLPLIFAIPIALILGICAGYFGGRFDDFVVYVYSTLSSVPSLLLLITIVYSMGKSLTAVCFALAITGWVGICRLVRGETMKLRELEYIQAAKCLGVPTWKVILKHIMPNLVHIILITSIITFTVMVLAESILAYLGVGLESSWGTMIASAKSEIAQDPVIWWNLVFSSLFLFLLVLAVNIVGDAIRNAIDPKATQE